MKFDIIIIGAGIIGTSTAYHLQRQTKKKILLLEKGPTVAAGNTRQSAALYRNLFSSKTSQSLSTSSIAFYESITAEWTKESWVFMALFKRGLASFEKGFG